MILLKCRIFCLVVIVTVSQAQEDKESMDCKIHSDCLTDRGYCHPKTKMCLCKNGRSTYPVCNINKGSARDCEPNCSEEEYCDLNDKKCMCNLGGFPPNCNVKKCEPFEVELDGECTCMYGRNSDDECSKCRDVCGRNGACTKTGPNAYSCKCSFGGEFPECDSKNSSEDNLSPWGPWSECSRSCGRNSRRFRRRNCTRQESCSGDPDDEEEDCSFISCPSWSRWSKCSVTCGGGMKLRTRVCRGIENCDDEDIFQRPCNRRACRTPVNCNWCPWTNGNGLQPTRVRIPNCPAQSNGGAPCRGKAQKIPFNKCDPRNTIQDLGTIYSLDYHRGPDWYKNRFDVTCPGGCFEIIKAVHDCRPREPTPDEMGRVSLLCNGKERCQFVPGALFFGKNNPHCFFVAWPVVWLQWRCNGNGNRMIANNNWI